MKLWDRKPREPRYSGPRNGYSTGGRIGMEEAKANQDAAKRMSLGLLAALLKHHSAYPPGPEEAKAVAYWRSRLG